MWYLLMDLNQVCTYDAPGVKWPCPWGHKEHRNKEGKLQNSSSLKLEGVDLSYLVYSISLWTFINCILMIPVASKLAPTQGITSWNNSIKEGRIDIVGKIARAIRGHHGPLVSRVCSTSLLKTCNKQFLLFPQCFLPLSSNLKLSSATSFSFEFQNFKLVQIESFSR